MGGKTYSVLKPSIIWVLPACPDVVTYLPTIMSSHSEARDLKLLHMSMVKMVLALLKIEVREDMRAAIITAIIRPLSPGQLRKHTQTHWSETEVQVSCYI